MYFLEVPVCIFLCPFVSTIAGKLQYHCGSTGVFPRWYWRKYVLCLHDLTCFIRRVPA